MLILVEGIEASGKTTLVNQLVESLQVAYPSTPVTRSRTPGGTPLGAKLRDILLDPGFSIDPYTEVLLFAADFSLWMNELIIPAVERGEIVITDRWCHSVYAYQGGGSGVSLNWIDGIYQPLLAKSVPPDLAISTIWLDIPPEVTLARLAIAGKNDRIEQSGLQYWQDVSRGYREVFRQLNPHTYTRIDATASINSIHQLALAAIKNQGKLSSRPPG